jgi:hypothetical protein
MSGARACADEPDAKRARADPKQPPKEPPPIFYPASEQFKGLSLPDLPRELQSEILALVTNVKADDLEGGDCAMKVRCKRLALVRRLGKQLAYALLGKMCTVAFLATGTERRKWREALEATPTHRGRFLAAQLTNFFNRDVVVGMMMRTYNKESPNHGRSNGRAAFKGVQMMFKIQDVENRWYHECLQANENNDPLPIFQPAESEEWKELKGSFC